MTSQPVTSIPAQAIGMGSSQNDGINRFQLRSTHHLTLNMLNFRLDDKIFRSEIHS
jgi:hypothetical protein